ncbi:CLUMA_CG008547, isoform A [Clunio marinus]|uniref:CLUMA_CG008547, isoform A n=1 Tax=Clunio marinus TaxID=568069 RepID=A0A1J1I450_9DIPT|nr:CLUMA_CG008547, isoform A [Clunio marinus]
MQDHELLAMSFLLLLPSMLHKLLGQFDHHMQQQKQY